MTLAVSYKAAITGDILPFVSKPSRYIAAEWNSVAKDPAQVEVRVALAFPDVYEIGMSHLGLKILYQLLNDRAEVMAERVYAPWLDAETRLRERTSPQSGTGLPLPVSTSWAPEPFLCHHPTARAGRSVAPPIWTIPWWSRRAVPFPEPLADFVDAFRS
jgi:hypothetical protein